MGSWEHLNDDAIWAILLKVDLKTLVRTASSAKKWHTIIMSPAFISSYKAVHPSVLALCGYGSILPAVCVFSESSARFVPLGSLLPAGARLLRGFYHFSPENRVFQQADTYSDTITEYRMGNDGEWMKNTRQSCVAFSSWPYGMASYPALDEEVLHMCVWEEQTLPIRRGSTVYFPYGKRFKDEHGVYFEAHDLVTSEVTRIYIAHDLEHSVTFFAPAGCEDLLMVRLSGNRVHVFVYDQKVWKEIMQAVYNLYPLGRSIEPFGSCITATRTHVVMLVFNNVIPGRGPLGVGILAVYDGAKGVWQQIVENDVLVSSRCFTVDMISLLESRILSRSAQQASGGKEATPGGNEDEGGKQAAQVGGVTGAPVHWVSSLGFGAMVVAISVMISRR